MVKPPRGALSLRTDRLEDLCVEAGWSYQDLAWKAGITPEYFSRVRHGRGRPGARLVSGLCTALNVRFDELFEIVAEEVAA